MASPETVSPPPPMLDLVTTRVRPTVRIDQMLYDLRTIEDLTLEWMRWLERHSGRIHELLEARELGPAEGLELSALVDRVCRIALVAPDAVQDRLSDLQRVLVAQAFTERLPRSLARTSAPATEASPSTGTRRSRVSNASTAARRTTGAARRRSASSARI